MSFSYNGWLFENFEDDTALFLDLYKEDWNR